MARLVSWQSRKDLDILEQARLVLQAGGIVACPTETYYGLAADAFQEAALARILAIKGRSSRKPLLVLVADAGMVEQVAIGVTPQAERLMACFWPGPLTLVLRARPSLSQELTGGTGTIGVRQSSHPLAQILPAAYGRPLTGTSANRSGQSPLTRAHEVEREFGTELELILDSGPCQGGMPSTVLDLTRHPPHLVRPGAVSKAALLEVIDLD